MDAIATAEHFIENQPGANDAEVFKSLLNALQQGLPFDLHRLYALSLDDFELAVEVLNAWRLQRYYRGGAVSAAAIAPSGH